MWAKAGAGALRERPVQTLARVELGYAAVPIPRKHWFQMVFDAPRCLGGALLLSVALHAAAIELAPCTLAANAGRQEVGAQCGRLAVPVDAEQPAGASIELFVAVAPAIAEHAASDPLTVIAGGPGDAATSFFAGSSVAFERIRRTRDIVLVDQRGSGASAPLHCAGFDGKQSGGGLDMDATAVVTLTRNCLADLDHDPRFFTTSIAVTDLEQVREALGYERLNLYGISYGTRVAQHYLRRYPSRVRRVVLDGVVPAVVPLGAETALHSQAALDALFARCEADAACDAAYPTLRAQFYRVLEELTNDARAMTVAHPRTGVATAASVSRLTLVGVTRLAVYSPITASLLPAIIDAAHRGDYAPLASQAIAMEEQLGHLAIGLNYAVLCSEDHPFWGERDVAAQARTFMGSTFVDTMDRICEFWPRGPVDADFKEPVSSDVPVLILSGELDPITPPHYAPLVAAHLDNALPVIAPGQGHGMLLLPCMQRLMADFLDLDDPMTLDTGCVERIRPFPLFTSPLGPPP